MRRTETRLLFTCEHGGNKVPKAFEHLFADEARRLASHRGWDQGALQVARALAFSMQAPLIASSTTRLLVDLNRSPENPRVFSDSTRSLPRGERDTLLARHHKPHWDRVTEFIESNSEMTLHIAVHSFTPTLQGASRPFAIGLLYDPKRAREKRFVFAWQRILREQFSMSDVRRNAPYRGDSDGLTTSLRKTHAADRYLGIELELNQARLVPPGARRSFAGLLTHSLHVALSDESRDRSEC